MSSDLCLIEDFSFSPLADSTTDFLQFPIFEEKPSNLENSPHNKFEYLAISPNLMSQNHFNFDTQFLDFSDSEANPVLINKDEEIINLDGVAPTLFKNILVSSKSNSQNVLNPETHYLEMKTQEMETYGNSRPRSYGGAENVERFMQRSYSGSSFNVKPNICFRQDINFVMENQNFQNQAIGSCWSSFGSGQLRRVCSTGDLQVTKGVESSYVSNIEDARRYSVEERKERIHKYRAKRKQRNFNKTIKYACRKTLADNRPRVRGRFARNDETIEITKTSNFSPFEEEDDDSWVDGNNEDERTVRGTIFSILGPTHFQYYSFS